MKIAQEDHLRVNSSMPDETPNVKTTHTRQDDSVIPAIDWGMRQGNAIRKFLVWLERMSLAVEAPINRWVRSPEFNPLYHTGPLAVFLVLIIIVTGIYLTMFFPFGFEASYQAVRGIESNVIGRVVRGLHRYASDALLIVAVLHGWRTLFMDRFRGPRWLAWVSGIIMGGSIWLAGITGYWLVMDARSRVLNDVLIRLVNGWRAGTAFVVRTLTPGEGNTGWVFILIIITIHLGVTALGGLFYWLHIKRLNRPKHFPPRFWFAISGSLLIITAVLVPLGMLPPWDLSQLPGSLDIDLWYLFFLPVALGQSAWMFWSVTLIIFLLIGLLPWLLKRSPPAPIVINTERCTGCTLCAIDCPYKALRMVERKDGKRHKYVAEVNPKLCVACGICIGACQPDALALNGQYGELHLGEMVQRATDQRGSAVKLVFACERHAAHARMVGSNNTEGQVIKGYSDPVNSLVIPVTCIGMVHPKLAEAGIKAGAAEVLFVGCPPEDCANREGNLWMAQRLSRLRLPKLHLTFSTAPILTNWTSPDRFKKALSREVKPAESSAYNLRLVWKDWRRYLPAVILSALVLGGIVLLSQVPYQAYTQGQAMVEIVLDHQSGNLLDGAVLGSVQEENERIRLVLEVDGQEHLDRQYQPAEDSEKIPILERVWVSPGEARVRVLLYDSAAPNPAQILYDQVVNISPGMVLALHFHDQKSGGDAEEGERIFYGGAANIRAGCAICHSLEPDISVVGPSLAGVAERAGKRVPGLSAEDYLRQSILEPDAFLVEGYSAGMMPANYAEILDEQQVKDVLAFLATLK